ncbi:MAG: hypothetical protein CL472_08180 [Acidobacteria bacterium]|nr:hypothetical protein [Acidobacteriota bacterium]
MIPSSAPAVDYERDETLLALIRSLVKKTSRTDSRQIALLVYLTDWRSALVNGHQATTIEWRLDLRGPKTRAIEDIVRSVRAEKGRVGDMLKSLSRRNAPLLDAPTTAALEHVLATTNKMGVQDLNRNVLATWPVLHSNAESAREVYDLAKAALEYRASKGGII